MIVCYGTNGTKGLWAYDDEATTLLWSVKTLVEIYAVAIDLNDNVYAAGSLTWDAGLGKLVNIWKYDSDGNLLAAGAAVGGGAPLYTLAVDSNGYVFAGGPSPGGTSECLWRYSSDLSSYDVVLPVSDYCTKVLVDDNDDIYASTSGGNGVYKFNSSLVQQWNTKPVSPSSTTIYDMAFYGNTGVLVTTIDGGSLYGALTFIYASDGKLGSMSNIPGAAASKTPVAVDPSNNDIFICNSGTDYAYKYTYDTGTDSWHGVVARAITNTANSKIYTLDVDSHGELIAGLYITDDSGGRSGTPTANYKALIFNKSNLVDTTLITSS
jgi:hypothetical protein